MACLHYTILQQIGRGKLLLRITAYFGAVLQSLQRISMLIPQQ